MKVINLLVVLVILSFSTSSFGENIHFKPVQELFFAMSAVDHQKMKSVVTEDFQLLEVGEDWTIDDLINVVKPSDYRRRNYFSVIKSETLGGMAWVSYWNKATFINGDKKSTVAWLESAVLVKSDHQWKIKMLHSTRIKAENIPQEVVLTEYTK